MGHAQRHKIGSGATDVLLLGVDADAAAAAAAHQLLPSVARSRLHGHVPARRLQQIFPWADFYGGSQRAYLAKDEYVTGSYGVEGRFPFLDTRVVQASLSLSADLKNKYYKAASQLYMAKHLALIKYFDGLDVRYSVDIALEY